MSDNALHNGERLVLVLGHPGYYPRFGFAPAERYGIRPTFEVAGEAMMVRVLDGSGGVPRGMIRYPACLRGLMSSDEFW